MSKINKLFNNFFKNEKTGGILLIICTLISLSLANSPFQIPYSTFWEIPVKFQFGDLNFFSHHGEDLTLSTFINDALMAIFFLMVGLELRREIYIGELSDSKKASLPLIAAFGGMLVPAGIYLLFNYGTDSQSGIGVPMATDIAFALGVLSLLGKRVPVGLKIFLMGLAVIDDLGAIIIIALFYSTGVSFFTLGIALGTWVILLILNRLRIHNLIPYLIGGLIMWYFMLNSGVHATIAGVLLSFAIPFQKGEENSISYKLQNKLHLPVTFLILPLFALANTAIVIEASLNTIVTENYSLGIFFGLFLGKPLGIFLFTFVAVTTKLSSLPEGVNWKGILGAGMLGGIGFTMSIFITLLAFDPEAHRDYINNAKLMILISSLCAAVAGYVYLNFALKSKNLKV